MSRKVALYGALLVLAIIALVVLASRLTPGSTLPLAGARPTGEIASPTFTLSGAPVASPVSPLDEPKRHQAVIADWEELFRVTQSYESVHANGKPDDQAWWGEQYGRFYTGVALAEQMDFLKQAFRPGSQAALAFIENAHYTVEVAGCASDTECTLNVHMQSGKFWAYHVRSKRWSQANPLEPVVWTMSMRYDPVAGRWQVK